MKPAPSLFSQDHRNLEAAVYTATARNSRLKRTLMKLLLRSWKIPPEIRYARTIEDPAIHARTTPRFRLTDRLISSPIA